MEWTRGRDPLSTSIRTLVDPEADWLLRTIPAKTMERPFGALLTLAGGWTARTFVEAGQSGAFGIDRRTWHRLIETAAIWVEGRNGFATILTADIGHEFLQTLAHNPALQSAIANLALCHVADLPRGVRSVSRSDRVQTRLWGPQPQVITAMIDDSIALGHARFQRPDGGSRIVSAWLQGCEPRQQGHWSEFGYGTHLDNAFAGDIDALLELKDDDLIANATGQTDFSRPGRNRLARHRSHGTHVLDLAAGGDTNPIIAVQLPEAVSNDYSGGNLARPVIDAIAFIMNEADRFALLQWGLRVPVVINLSYGNHEGPHDGSGALPAAMDTMIAARCGAFPHAPVSIVVAAGNSGNAQTHAQLTGGADGRCEPLCMKVLPDDRTISMIDVFAPRLRSFHICARNGNRCYG